MGYRVSHHKRRSGQRILAVDRSGGISARAEWSRRALGWGIETGSEIGLYYDPMLAKLIVHAPTRALAVARMRRALLELTIDGVETSRGFHLRVMDHPAFKSGDITIQWLEQTLPELTRPVSDPNALKLAAIAAALVTHAERTTSAPTRATTASGVNDGTSNSAGASWAALARRDALRTR